MSNVLSPLIDFFEGILKFFHDTLGLGWGMSIVALTIIVRACLLPLTLKQFHSMQQLVKHQPELKRIQEKYKNDKERMNQEIMRFYRENKVNPFGSCLPMLAQLPVFLGLFYTLRKDLKVDICGPALKAHDITSNAAIQKAACGDVQPAGGEQEFLFIPDLTDKATGAVLVALIVMYVGSQLLSTLLMSTTTDRNQKMIMLALPFIFLTFVIQFPAGLVVYWITTNLWTIVQQTIVRRRLGPLRPKEEDGGGGPPTKPPGPLGGLKRATRVPEPVAVGGTAGRPKPARTGPPPPSPRKKKKRSGRRR